jgi:hypothetical protein
MAVNLKRNPRAKCLILSRVGGRYTSWNRRKGNYAGHEESQWLFGWSRFVPGTVNSSIKEEVIKN